MRFGVLLRILGVGTMRFGVSTHLYHDQRLDREHLVEIAAHGFDCVELFATRTHFDYHDAAAVRALAEWLDDTRLTLNSVHAPICASLIDGTWGETYLERDRRRPATPQGAQRSGGGTGDRADRALPSSGRPSRRSGRR